MKLINGIARFFEQSGKLRVMAYLRGLPDNQLLAWGFSPAQLNQGISGWPWRLDTPPATTSTIENTSVAVQNSIKELQRFSDVELADLGLNRGSIEDAVRNGRPGIEISDTPQAA
ncbi:MAG: DUF1127 domain-containing protein [Granulosicoccus sp.]|nr:DUF1127 domain-containing protein [Granulosicoccus sp.]